MGGTNTGAGGDAVCKSAICVTYTKRYLLCTAIATAHPAVLVLVLLME